MRGGHYYHVVLNITMLSIYLYRVLLYIYFIYFVYYVYFVYFVYFYDHGHYTSAGSVKVYAKYIKVYQSIRKVYAIYTGVLAYCDALNHP
jgi:hypothetical protein